MRTQKKPYRRLKFRVFPARKPTEEELSYCKKLLAFGVLSWQDTHLLVHFLSDQCKILPRRATGLSSKDHKTVTKLIKMARINALLPFTHPKGVPITLNGATYHNPSTWWQRKRKRYGKPTSTMRRARHAVHTNPGQAKSKNLPR